MKSVALLALIVTNLAVRSQSIDSHVVNSTGNSYSQGRYNIEWSVGELTLVGSMQSSTESIIITNGFLQPAIANAVDSNAHRFFTKDEIKILPNPTYNRIEINFSTEQKGTLYLNVYDANGKALTGTSLISNGILMSKFIDLSPFASGTYFLKIDLQPSEGSIRKTGSYKIVKL
jgi:Secretion system C-terminal sorting domain